MIVKTPKKILALYEGICDVFERYLVFCAVAGFIAGIAIATYNGEFSDSIYTVVNNFVDGYELAAPVVIFLILTPSLARMFNTHQESLFGRYVIRWYFLRKFLACLWAILFTVVVFNSPFFPERIPSCLRALEQTMRCLGDMAVQSSYFQAMYLSVFVAFLSTKVRALFRTLDKTLQNIELLVRYFLPVIPVFMLAIGAYIHGLPVHLNEQLAFNAEMRSVLHEIHLFGIRLDPNNAMQMVSIYALGSLLTGLACFPWHGTLLYLAKRRIIDFSLKNYFLNYWVKIYPLLWSTSSESIATPLNLYLTKKFAPRVQSSVRQFVIGIGSYMNINGTLICVYILGGLVLDILGVRVSLVEWLLTIPVVMLISYGVPGIPGELVMFAGPLGTMLNLPPDILPAFLAIFIGLQIGLPDSFRTGNNSTDDFVCTIILDDIYKKKFQNDAIAFTDEEANV